MSALGIYSKRSEQAMTGRIEQRLTELGIVLPVPNPPAANYVPFVTVGTLVFISGQTARSETGVACAGKVERDVTIDKAAAAARMCALSLLAHLKVACGGDLDRVVRCVRLTGYVNSDPEFREQPRIINGASDLMVAVFGERGRHARTAISAAALPSGATVEVEGIFEIERNHDAR